MPIPSYRPGTTLPGTSRLHHVITHAQCAPARQSARRFRPSTPKLQYPILRNPITQLCAGLPTAHIPRPKASPPQPHHSMSLQPSPLRPNQTKSNQEPQQSKPNQSQPDTTKYNQTRPFLLPRTPNREPSSTAGKSTAADLPLFSGIALPPRLVGENKGENHAYTIVSPWYDLARTFYQQQ